MVWTSKPWQLLRIFPLKVELLFMNKCSKEFISHEQMCLLPLPTLLITSLLISQNALKRRGNRAHELSLIPRPPRRHCHRDGADNRAICLWRGGVTGQIEAFKKTANKWNPGHLAEVELLNCVRNGKCLSRSRYQPHCHCQSFHAPVGPDKSKRGRHRLFLLWSLWCKLGLIKGPLGCWMGSH